MRQDYASGTSTAIASNQNGPLGLALSASFVYFTNLGDSSANGSIVRVPLSGGTPVTLKAGLLQPASIVIDAASIYWGSSGPGASSSAISKMPIGGGTVPTLASVQSYFSNGGIASDGVSVYWATFSAVGSVMKVPVNGGAPETIASGLPSPVSVAVTGNSVFFTSYGGTIGKITPK